MKQGWEIKKLGEVCEISTGNANTEDAIENGEYAFFDRSKLIKKSSTYLYDCEAIIIAGEGATFLPKFYSGKFNLHQRAYAIFNFNKNVDIQYVNKYLIHFHRYFQRVAVGATVKSLRLRHFQELPIPIPHHREQLRIVAILDEAFTAIAKAKANAEQNLKNAKELFESYLQGVFEKKGEGWEESKLYDVCEIKPQKKEAREKLKETDLVTFLPMEDLGVLNKEIIGVKERTLKEVSGSYTYFADNDVLLAKITPCFENGKIGIARNLTNGVGFGSSEYIVFRSHGIIEPEYLYYFLSRNQIREEGKKYMSGAVGHKRVSKDWIENYIISFPKSLKAQDSIVEKIDALSVETKRLEAIYQQKINDLEELKKSVLQKAFSGELKTSKVLVYELA